MREQFSKTLRGYVRIQVLGSMPERFLNLCGSNQIRAWDLRSAENRYELKLPASDFLRLKPFLKKSRCRAVILEKRGMPFFLHKMRKRKAFFLGLLLAASMLYLLSSFVWNIHVTGNRINSTQAVLEALKKEGVVHGLPKRRVPCQEIADFLREEFPDIVWVSAKIQGTRLILEIKENENASSERRQPSEEMAGPSELRATKNGTVIKIVTRSGVPQVAAGDSCQKGTLLISGEIPIYNDNQEIVRYRQVAADGDVYLATSRYYRDEIPLSYERRVYTGQESRQRFLQVLDWRLTLGGAFSLPESYDQVAQSSMLRLTENFVLPVSYGSITTRPYRVEKEEYTEEEAKELARRHLEQYLEGLKEKGAAVTGRQIEVTVEEGLCIASGTIETVEKNGMQTKIEAPGEISGNQEEQGA